MLTGQELHTGDGHDTQSKHATDPATSRLIRHARGSCRHTKRTGMLLAGNSLRADLQLPMIVLARRSTCGQLAVAHRQAHEAKHSLRCQAQEQSILPSSALQAAIQPVRIHLFMVANAMGLAARARDVALRKIGVATRWVAS